MSSILPGENILVATVKRELQVVRDPDDKWQSMESDQVLEQHGALMNLYGCVLACKSAKQFIRRLCTHV